MSIQQTLQFWWRRAVWTVKQAVPLTYRSRYRDADGNQHLAVWRMWWGRVFDLDDVVVAEDR